MPAKRQRCLAFGRTIVRRSTTNLANDSDLPDSQNSTPAPSIASSLPLVISTPIPALRSPPPHPPPPPPPVPKDKATILLGLPLYARRKYADEILQ